MNRVTRFLKQLQVDGFRVDGQEATAQVKKILNRGPLVTVINSMSPAWIAPHYKAGQILQFLPNKVVLVYDSKK